MNQVRRQRRLSSQWPELLAQWSKSGESAEKFAARVGVKPATLWRWRKSAAGKSAAKAALAEKTRSESSPSMFARVEVVEPPTRSRGLVEVVLLGGVAIRIHGEVDADALAAVLGALSRC